MSHADALLENITRCLRDCNQALDENSSTCQAKLRNTTKHHVLFNGQRAKQNCAMLSARGVIHFFPEIHLSPVIARAPAPPGGQMAMLVSLLYGGGGEVW